MRTSLTDPIRVAWLDTGLALRGRVGLTFAPGKRSASLFGPDWARDLDVDLDQLRGEGVDFLAPLIEDDELELLGIPTLVEAAAGRGMTVARLPIPDGGIPDILAARSLVERIVAHARAGGGAVTHCRGGLGRAGTIAACCLVALGADPRVAVREVRSVRPGAIENEGQERFVAEYAARQRASRENTS
jgi:protein-tyrosine phosphatase